MQALLQLVALACALIAFLITLVAMPPYIKMLRARKMQQYLRKEGPQSHAKKAGTPTAGGIVFTVVFLVVVLGGWMAFAGMSQRGTDLSSVIKTQVSSSFPVVMAALLCGLLGFLDDAAKIRNKSNAGISGKMRLAAEAFIGLALGIMILPVGHKIVAFGMDDPTKVFNLSYVTSEVLIHQLPVLFVLLCVFLMMATTNAVNLHDGMDWLAGGTTFMVFATLAFMFATSGQPVLCMLAATVCGALGGFLVFNKNPAQIFMGDTGSLFLGGLMAGLVAAGGMVLYFIPLSIIYICEALSVMAQVIYFKATKPWQPEEPMADFPLLLYKLTHRVPGEGKRLFRITPLHHHFEAVGEEQGVSETQVVLGFWLVQFMLCTIVLAAWFTYDMHH